MFIFLSFPNSVARDARDQDGTVGFSLLGREVLLLWWPSSIRSAF